MEPQQVGQGNDIGGSFVIYSQIEGYLLSQLFVVRSSQLGINGHLKGELVLIAGFKLSDDLGYFNIHSQECV